MQPREVALDLRLEYASSAHAGVATARCGKEQVERDCPLSDGAELDNGPLARRCWCRPEPDADVGMITREVGAGVLVAGALIVLGMRFGTRTFRARLG